jgi:beta-lactam-binding protein with PASTA domain
MLKALRHIGLVPQVKLVDGWPDGAVQSVSPPSGTLLAKGSEVKVTVYSGEGASSPPTTATAGSLPLPSVVADNAGSAETIIMDLGLRVIIDYERLSNDCGSGGVISQDPPADSLVAPNSIVTITVEEPDFGCGQ